MMNRTNSPTALDDLYDVPPGIIALLSCFYGIISLIAIVGNFCVLILVGTSRRMRTVTNYFIANLAAADILIGMFSIPFQAALLQRWVLPPFMCAFCPFVQVLSVNVSIATLTAIALDRYRAVMHPLRARTSKLSAKMAILGIWMLSALASVPYAMALRVTLVYDPTTGNETRPFCHNTLVSPFVWKIYNHALVTLQYFLPLGVISVVYIAIGLKLREPGNIQGENRMRNRHKVIKMSFVAVLLFALCWLPLQTYNILQDVFPDINRYRYINIIWFCCHWLALANACCNPFVYAIFNERFNTEFRNTFSSCASALRRRTRDEAAAETAV